MFNGNVDIFHLYKQKSQLTNLHSETKKFTAIKTNGGWVHDTPKELAYLLRETKYCQNKFDYYYFESKTPLFTYVILNYQQPEKFNTICFSNYLPLLQEKLKLMRRDAATKIGENSAQYIGLWSGPGYPYIEFDGNSGVLLFNERGESTKGHILGHELITGWGSGRFSKDGKSLFWANGSVWERS